MAKRVYEVPVPPDVEPDEALAEAQQKAKGFDPESSKPFEYMDPAVVPRWIKTLVDVQRLSFERVYRHTGRTYCLGRVDTVKFVIRADVPVIDVLFVSFIINSGNFMQKKRFSCDNRR